MDRIHHILQQFPADCAPFRVESLGSAGGMSGAQFWRVMAPRGTLAVRRWPAEHPPADRLRFIHSVINHAATNGIMFVPTPIATHDGNTFVGHDGHLWELAPWMPGTAGYEHSPSEDKLRSAMTALAQFHNAVADVQLEFELAATLRVSGSSAIPRRLARLRELGRSELAELKSAIRDSPWPEFASLARQFVAAVPNAIPPAIDALEPLENASLTLQPCLRDIWHDHVLFTGNEVSGLVDFGAVDIDTPTTDIARLLGSLAGEPSLPFRNRPLELEDRTDDWRTGLAAYSGTRPLSQQEMSAVFALNSANPILAGCNWIRWIYVDGRQFENPGQILTRFQRLLSHMQSPPLQ